MPWTAQTAGGSGWIETAPHSPGRIVEPTADLAQPAEAILWPGCSNPVASRMGEAAGGVWTCLLRGSGRHFGQVLRPICPTIRGSSRRPWATYHELGWQPRL